MLFANLPVPTPALIGQLQTTTDQGVCYCNGSIWVIIGFPPTSTGSVSLVSPGNTISIAGSSSGVITEDVGSQFAGALRVLGGLYTFATLPAAASNANVYASTSDVGAVYSNGAVWLQLYNQTASSLAIANNPPLISGSNGVAYSLQLSATGGAAPYTWIKVSQFADTNAWTVSSTGVLACASPATSTLDNITVQVTDTTGAAIQKLLTVSIAASTGTPAGTPTFSPAPGTYTGTQTVTISDASAGTTIYYTTNGSTPTTSSPIYTAPLSVSVSQTINAIAVGGSFTQSPIGSASYTLNTLTFNPPFPRLANMRFQQLNYTTVPYFNYPAYLAYIACRCIFGVGLNYTGNAANSFGSGGKGPWVAAAKAATLVPGGNRIVQYVEPMTYFGTNPTGASVRTNTGVLFSHIDANKWLYNTSYNAGTYPGTVLGNGTYSGTSTPIPYPNVSTYAPADSNGQQPEQFFAALSFQSLLSGTGPYAAGFSPLDAASAFDGFYHDDIWYCPDRGGDGDIDRDGIIDTGISTVIATGSTGLLLKANNWRAGTAQFYSQMEVYKPGFYRVANADYADHLLNHGITNDPTTIGAMNQVLDAAQMQYFLGWGFTEGNATFANIIAGIQLYQNMLRPGGIPLVDIAFLGGAGTSTFGTTPVGAAPLTWSGQNPVTYTPAYQGARYYNSLIMCVSNGALMNDGLSTTGATVIDIDTNLATFDEWGDFSQTGNCSCGYLGYPVADSTGALQTAAKYGNGIWERRFHNATTNLFYRVVFNPRGNGAQTYNPGVTLWKLNGTQNPAYNSNTSFTTLSMADTDGGVYCESQQTGGGGGGGGGTTQSILQFVPADVATSATSTSQALATVTAGSTILALCYTNFTSMGATPVQDTQGNTYNLVETVQSAAGPGNQTLRLYAAYNVPGGANTVTVNYATATTIRPVLLLEVGGTAAAPLDGHNHSDQASPGTGAGAVVSGAASNTAQPALAIGFSTPIFQTTPPTAVAPYMSAGTFWSASGTTGRCESLALTGTGSQQATFTTTLGTTEHLSALIILNHS